MPVFNKIQSDFRLGLTPPIVSGLEDLIYVFNQDDFVLTYDTDNPFLVTGITAVNAAKIYKFTGTNNSFTSSSKSARTAVGPRYEEEVVFNIAGNSTDIKSMIMAAGYGRVKAIVVNNFKDSDSAIELMGANNGLIADTERSSDESLEGGYKLTLKAPDKLREPYPPRAVLIAASGNTPPPASYASTIAAIEAMVYVAP